MPSVVVKVMVPVSVVQRRAAVVVPPRLHPENAPERISIPEMLNSAALSPEPVVLTLDT